MDSPTPNITQAWLESAWPSRRLGRATPLRAGSLTMGGPIIPPSLVAHTFLGSDVSPSDRLEDFTFMSLVPDPMPSGEFPVELRWIDRLWTGAYVACGRELGTVERSGKVTGVARLVLMLLCAGSLLDDESFSLDELTGWLQEWNHRRNLPELPYDWVAMVAKMALETTEEAS